MSCFVFYCVSYFYVSCSGSNTSVEKRELIFLLSLLVIMLFLLGGVSSSS